MGAVIGDFCFLTSYFAYSFTISCWEATLVNVTNAVKFHSNFQTKISIKEIGNACFFVCVIQSNFQLKPFFSSRYSFPVIVQFIILL